MAHAEGAFLWWRLSIPSFRTIAYIVDKQSGICMCFVVVVFFSNLNEKFWNKSTLIWVGFLGVCFYSNKKTSLKIMPSFEFAYLSCFLYIRLLWPVSVLTKNLSRRKKVYLKVFLNQFMLIRLTFTCSKSMMWFLCFYC